MRRRLLLGLGAALVLAACLPAPRAHGDGWTRVTTYLDSGVTYSGTYTTAGRTAGCALAHLGQTVHIVEAGLILVCEDTGSPWWFAADSNRVDVYALWLPYDYYTVWFE